VKEAKVKNKTDSLEIVSRKRVNLFQIKEKISIGTIGNHEV
jgi:hypothetical protein